MKRILIDYKKLDHEVASKLIDSYPYGYGDEDIITLKKPNGDIIEAVEVQTEDAIYLVKISKSLSNFMSSFEAKIEKELDKAVHTEIAMDLEKNLLPNKEMESEADNEQDG